jgi:hypothetical protein
LRVLERLRKVKNELTTVSFSVEDLDLDNNISDENLKKN